MDDILKSDTNSPVKRSMEVGQQCTPKKRTAEAVHHGSPQAGGSQDSPIKNRLNTSFWKRKKLDLQPKNECKVLKIADLKFGMSSDFALLFRVSLLGNWNTERTNFLKFHAHDGTGEVAVVAYEKASELAKSLKLNGIYKLEKFEVRREPSQFAQFTGTDLQLKVLPNSIVSEHTCDDIPEIPFNFISIADILTEKYDVHARVDVFGVIAEEWGAERTRGDNVKRDVRIVDQEMNEVILTLWGDAAEFFKGTPGDAIALRKAIIKVYNDTRLLNASGYTLIWTNPEFKDDRVEAIKVWFQKRLLELETGEA